MSGHSKWANIKRKKEATDAVKAKIFTKENGKISKKFGNPDLMILFTNTVSHKMVHCAVTEAEKCNAQIVRCHTSSGNALNEILQNACTA